MKNFGERMKELVYYRKIQVISNSFKQGHVGRTNREFTIESYKGFSQQEILNMEKSALKVVAYINDTNSINDVKDAMRTVIKELKTARDSHKTMGDLESKLQNYIVKFDTYKNHWEKKISHINDQEKRIKFQRIFHDATHMAFDSSNSFALTCCFRDYIIHGSNLIDNLRIDIDSVHIFANRDKLLNDWKWNKTKTELISSQSELIDLEIVIVESFEALSEIHEQLIDARTANVVSDCKYLLMQYDKIQIPEKYIPCWFIMEKRYFNDRTLGKSNNQSLRNNNKLNMKMLPLKWQDYMRILEYWKRIN